MSDEDVLMEDVSDEAAIRNISQDISKTRKTSKQSRKGQIFDTIRQRLPAQLTCLFLIDTNYIISHLSIIRGLVDAHAQSNAIVLVPWVVIQELDGLKNAFATYGQADLAQLSRNAIKYIYACLQAGDKGVRGQKIYEAIDSTATGDDAILDCAMYWHEKQAREVILLSNDKNLCSKMIIHGLRAISHELGQSSASILRQVLSVTEREGISSIEAINLAAHQPAMDTDEPQLPPPSAAIEMEIDPIIAPVVNPRKIDDPFEALAAKAGESRYKRTSRPLLVRGTSPESTYRRPARADSSPNQFIQRARSYSPDEMMAWSEGTRSRSSSPDSVRYSMTSSIRSSPGSPTSAKYRNLSVIEATILQRFPVLIKHHLQIEFKDESVVDLLVNDNAIKDVDNVLNLICQHWQVCFRKICQKSLSAYTSSRVLEGTSLRTYLKTLSAIFSTPSSEEKVVASLRLQKFARLRVAILANGSIYT